MGLTRRLRRRQPIWRWDLDLDLDLGPATGRRDFRHGRAEPALAWALLGATLGAIALGLMSGNVVYAPLGALVGAAYLLNAWSLTGGVLRLPLLCGRRRPAPASRQGVTRSRS